MISPPSFEASRNVVIPSASAEARDPFFLNRLQESPCCPLATPTFLCCFVLRPTGCPSTLMKTSSESFSLGDFFPLRIQSTLLPRADVSPSGLFCRLGPGGVFSSPSHPGRPVKENEDFARHPSIFPRVSFFVLAPLKQAPLRVVLFLYIECFRFSCSESRFVLQRKILWFFEYESEASPRTGLRGSFAATPLSFWPDLPPLVLRTDGGLVALFDASRS